MEKYRKSEIETGGEENGAYEGAENAPYDAGEKSCFPVLARSLQSLLEATDMPEFRAADADKLRRMKQAPSHRSVCAAIDALCDELSALLFVIRNADKCDVLPRR